MLVWVEDIGFLGLVWDWVSDCRYALVAEVSLSTDAEPLQPLLR
jgi:hypothetical protein